MCKLLIVDKCQSVSRSGDKEHRRTAAQPHSRTASMLMFSEDQRYQRAGPPELPDPDADADADADADSEAALRLARRGRRVTADTARELTELGRRLGHGAVCCDLRWSLFVSASCSFRRDSCVRPFPAIFLTEDLVTPKDFNSLVDTVARAPRFEKILEIIEKPEVHAEYADPVELLHHVLVEVDEPRLEAIDPKDIDDVLKLVPCEGPVCRPQYIFKVVASADSRFELKFQNLAAGKKTLHAFHGSRLENFYSILHHGLQQHMNKNMLFGPGIYLSSELSVSLPYSPGGFGWCNSNIGSNLSCVALCELIDTPDGVSCRKARGSSSENQQIPNKYYVVSNNDLVRVRYLLIYVNNENYGIQKVNIRLQNRGFVAKWICHHKMLTMLIGYCIMLVSIGFANYMPLQYYCRLLMRKLESSFKDFTFPSLN